ncbi:hypothetical protein [Paenibacillus sp. FSL W8-0194]|uniref:hypothetical protein n=1 Tax=Paenibacillus sp. FSL W8-0194 TaxID=2921711 RepID=UPI0030DBA1E4
MFKNIHLKEILMRLLALICIIIGARYLLNSTSMGDDRALEFLTAVGGSTDSADLKAHLESYIIGYRLFGGILLSVGLFRFLQK